MTHHAHHFHPLMFVLRLFVHHGPTFVLGFMAGMIFHHLLINYVEYWLATHPSGGEL